MLLRKVKTQESLSGVHKSDLKFPRIAVGVCWLMNFRQTHNQENHGDEWGGIKRGRKLGRAVKKVQLYFVGNEGTTR